MDGGYKEYSMGVEMWMEATRNTPWVWRCGWRLHGILHRCGDVDGGYKEYSIGVDMWMEATRNTP